MKQLKEEWKKYLADHPQWCKKIGNHHYFRTRHSSRFWIKKIKEPTKIEFYKK